MTDSDTTQKMLRENHNLDIAVMPCFVKDKNKKYVRIYSYAITTFDHEGYIAVPNGHKPFPKIQTYELAQEDAIRVCLDYIQKQNKTHGK